MAPPPDAGELGWTAASVSRPGRGRAENQDALAVSGESGSGLFLVADGVGGGADGGRASRRAVRILDDLMAREEAGAETLLEAIRRANREIFEWTGQVGRTGTTIVALWLGAGRARIAHAGDSRLYRWRAGRLEALTEDHSLGNELSRSESGRSVRLVDSIGRLLVRAIGAKRTIEVDLREVELRCGDRFLLVTDGVLAVRSEEELRDAVGGAGDPAELVEGLVPEEGGPDDASAIAVWIAGRRPEPRGERRPPLGVVSATPEED